MFMTVGWAIAGASSDTKAIQPASAILMALSSASVKGAGDADMLLFRCTERLLGSVGVLGKFLSRKPREKLTNDNGQANCALGREINEQ
jgi:hypothetical protein